MLIGHAVTYEHANGHVLLSNLNFKIPAGGTALVGANGVGKSIFARLLAGELLPSEGKIARKGLVFYLPQSSAAPRKTVGDFLSAVWESDGGRQALIAKLINAIPAERPLQNLSGGEWMRVRLAEALAKNWNFLILDEPTNNLDKAARDLIAEVLRGRRFSVSIDQS